jgi:hypothetical protein
MIDEHKIPKVKPPSEYPPEGGDTCEETITLQLQSLPFSIHLISKYRLNWKR